MPTPYPNRHAPRHRPSHPAGAFRCLFATGTSVARLKGGALMDMPFNLLTQNLEQSFRIVYDDYQALLGKKHYARDLLSLLHRWTDWASGQPESEQVERDGWIRLTAKDLAANLGFSHRNYEQARADLKEIGHCRMPPRAQGAWQTGKAFAMNLISLGSSCPHHLRCSVAHFVTKPVTKPILSVTKLGFSVMKPHYEIQKFVTKLVTKPLFFRPTLFKALRNRYETPQNPMFRNKKVEGVT